MTNLEHGSQSRTENLLSTDPLNFTGNWYIDAGILGFIYLMEEVYGWSLEELKRKIRENPEKVYFGYFPIAYVRYVSLYKNELLNALKEIWRSLYELDIEKNKSLKTVLRKLESEIKKAVKLLEEMKNRELLEREKLDNILSEFLNFMNTINFLKENIEKNKKTSKRNVKEFKEKEESLKNCLKYLKSKVIEDLGIVENLLKKQIRISESEIFEIDKEIRDIRDKEKIFEISFKYITKYIRDFGARGIFSLFMNYKIFNPSVKREESFKKNFKEALGLNINKTKPLIEKTSNKFLPSIEEFGNIAYTKELIDEDRLKEITYNYIYHYILTFPLGLNYLDGKYFLFYSPDLEYTYRVNNKIKKLIEKVEKEKKRKYSIFEITINSLIDNLLELKSIWSLENMYIVEFRYVPKYQKIENIHYIGIRKLQASILIDDTLRDALNKEYKDVWIVKEFIKGKPLFPILLRIISEYYINRLSKQPKKVIRKKDLLRFLYINLIEAKIKEMSNNSNSLFSRDFFYNYKGIAKEIKKEVRQAYIITKHINNLFKHRVKNVSNKKKTIYALYSALKCKNLNYFLYIFLKELFVAYSTSSPELKKLKKDHLERIIKYLCKKILSNLSSWENYALNILLSLLFMKVTEKKNS